MAMDVRCQYARDEGMLRSDTYAKDLPSEIVELGEKVGWEIGRTNGGAIVVKSQPISSLCFLKKSLAAAESMGVNENLEPYARNTHLVLQEPWTLHIYAQHPPLHLFL